ncbi:glycosyltransferase [Nocardia sp. NPDC049149]|uniref:glycosyltransferase family protein n=1 Tax=Nocardia sp. NPDC049149 TaxID=3364315 RepID=UPI003714FC4B
MRLIIYGNGELPYCSEVHHKRSLEALGVDVLLLQENKVPTEQLLEEALEADVMCWVHTHGFANRGALSMQQVLRMLRSAGVPTLSYHLDLFRPIKRWEEYKGSPLWDIEYFFTVDAPMADHLNEYTNVKAHFLPAGVLEDECYISDQPSPYANDVVFVGSKNYHIEWKWRGQLISWLRQTYGDRFTHVGGDGDTGTLRGDDLNRMYANSKVAVGDTLCMNFDYPLYHSDRIWECGGRFGAQVHPRIAGLDQWFKDGEHLLYFNFGDFDDLRSKIDWMLEHDEERERIRRAGHEMVKASGTYRHRWETILDTVFA